MAKPTFDYGNPIPDVDTVKVGGAIPTHDTGAFFTGATSYAIDQTPDGMSFNTGNGQLTGAPTQAGVTQCRVTGINVDGETPSNLFKVPVLPSSSGAAHTGNELYRII